MQRQGRQLLDAVDHAANQRHVAVEVPRGVAGDDVELGSGPLGFYREEGDKVPIRSLRFGTDYDPGWQALRTDTATFAALVNARRYRREDWFVDPAGAIGLCNVPLPARRGR